MMGLGVGGIVAAIFHLFTHAFFKALLFLGAGSVNHATGTFDMRKMGGLYRYQPVTFWTIFIASMALVGFFPLAGFWSKDEILADAWADRPWVFWIALAGVFVTALYVGRMIILTFFGEYKGGEPITHGGAHGAAGEPAQEHPPTAHHQPSTPHESPPVMLFPLAVLALLAAVAGFANLGDDMTHLISGWLPQETEELATEGDFKMWIALASTGAGIAGLAVAWLIYQVQVLKSEKIAAFLQPLPEILENKYYLDTLYEDVLIKGGLLRGIGLLVSMWDQYVVDGFVNGVGRLTRWTSGQMRALQAGQAQLYATFVILGVVGAIAGILVVNP